jgi:hypothetical protein
MRTYILLILALVSISACRKTPQSKKTTISFTSAMSGSRIWHGFYASALYYPPYTTTSGIHPDTSFALTIINDSNINVFGDNYVVDSVDSAKGVIFFGLPQGSTINFSAGSYSGNFSSWTYYTYGLGFGVAYFYLKDSLAFVRGDLGHNWMIKDVRYTD